MGEFRMPSLGADMDAGTLVEWLKRPGDAVHRGDVIAVVETQKGAIEIEVFETGILDRVMMSPGVKVPVGTPMAIIRAPGAAPTAAPSLPAAPALAAPPPPAAAALVTPIRAPVGPRPHVSPAARKLAESRGISPAGIVGTGPDGAVVRADVERAAAPAPHPPEGARRRGLDLGEMRKAIAAAMAKSKREIPHYYLSHSIDMTATLDWLKAFNAARQPPERLLLAALLLKAVALALEEFPEFNGTYTDDGFHPSQAIHIGTAIAIRGGGLVAPAIHDADEKTLDELMAALHDLVARTRAGRLRGSELFDPTITVTSLGERGVDSVLGIIYPPQVAIVGFGAPASRPWVIDGRIEPRPVMTATLAGDHRVSDGHRGALLLIEVERRLQHPDAL
jgi:pyruvate dehydrogenase E2 component (dihydrolipoamide acetyltransferase)